MGRVFVIGGGVIGLACVLRRRVFLASRHAMLGVMLASATAVAVTKLVWAGRSHFDLSAFDPSRFGRLGHAA